MCRLRIINIDRGIILYMVLEIFFVSEILCVGVIVDDFVGVDMWVYGMFFYNLLNLYEEVLKEEEIGDIKDKIVCFFCGGRRLDFCEKYVKRC